MTEMKREKKPYLSLLKDELDMMRNRIAALEKVMITGEPDVIEGTSGNQYAVVKGVPEPEYPNERVERIVDIIVSGLTGKNAITLDQQIIIRQGVGLALNEFYRGPYNVIDGTIAAQAERIRDLVSECAALRGELENEKTFSRDISDRIIAIANKIEDANAVSMIADHL